MRVEVKNVQTGQPAIGAIVSINSEYFFYRANNDGVVTIRDEDKPLYVGGSAYGALHVRGMCHEYIPFVQEGINVYEAGTIQVFLDPDPSNDITLVMRGGPSTSLMITVRSFATNEPIAGAQVRCVHNETFAGVTNANGEVLFPDFGVLMRTRYAISITADGYQQIQHSGVLMNEVAATIRMGRPRPARPGPLVP